MLLHSAAEQGVLPCLPLCDANGPLPAECSLSKPSSWSASGVLHPPVPGS